MLKIKNLLIMAGLVMAATSCKTPTDITYFQDLNNGQTLNVAPSSMLTAQPDDRISIVVHSKDPQLAEVFNLPVYSRRIGSTNSTGTSLSSMTSANNSSGQTASYTVDSFGDIDFPVLGTINIGGKTRQQIAQMIKDELIKRQLLLDPTVTVDFLDHSYTVLGAVNKPGRVVFDRDRLNLVEAIGMAGDLRLDGLRTNVKVIRMEEGKEKAYTVDLTDAASLYSSPVFYVQQNDVIYVEPNNTSKRTTTANGNSPFTPAFWISLASFASTVALLILKW